jgi:GNAT superfamily N-acetyltransferase
LIRIAVDPFPPQDELSALFAAAWGSAPSPTYVEQVLPRSLAHLGAFEGQRLVGFVNVAWDGGVHAFLLDTSVHPELQRRGIATQIVQQAADVARARGAEWLHVDFEPRLEAFYRACGFAPTAAGLIRLK